MITDHRKVFTAWMKSEALCALWGSGLSAQ